MKARRVAQRDHANMTLKANWDRRQERLKRRELMDRSTLIETLARMWMQCDPNRGGSDPDEIMPMEFCSGGVGDGTSAETETHKNPLGGEPRWKWFVPRAEATLDFLKKNGLQINRV